MNLTYSDYFPFPLEEKHFGIGIIGCGSIVRGAHLPAYKICDYKEVICCDVVEAAAREVAKSFGIDH